MLYLNKIKRQLTFIMPVLFIFTCVTSFYAQEAKGNPYLLQVGVKDRIYSSVLNENRTLYIQFPADYHPEKGTKYPVAYLLDGEVFLPTLAEVQRYYSGGFTPEMILVGISNETHRTRDLTI